MGNICTRGIGNASASTVYCEQVPPSQMPSQPVAQTPSTSQTPLQGLNRRPAESTPSMPHASRLWPALPPLQNWEIDALSRVQVLAHRLGGLIERTYGHPALDEQLDQAIGLLNQMRAYVSRQMPVGGGDDLAKCVSRIETQISQYHVHLSRSGQTPLCEIERDADEIAANVKDILDDIDFSLKAAKAGNNMALMGLTHSPAISRGVANMAFNMVAYYGSRYTGPTGDSERRVQNLLMDINDRAPVPRIVSDLVNKGTVRWDAPELVSTLRQLVLRYPLIGDRPNWRRRAQSAGG